MKEKTIDRNKQHKLLEKVEICRLQEKEKQKKFPKEKKNSKRGENDK